MSKTGDCLDVKFADHVFTFEWTTDRIQVPRSLMSSTFDEVLRPYCDDSPSFSSDMLVDELLGLLLGTGKYRFRPRPSAEGRDVLRNRIANAVAADLPLTFLTMWGAVKHYVVDDDQGPDLAEVFALFRLLELVESIKRIYPPGAVVRIVVEDFGVWYEDAYGRSADRQESVVRNSGRYVSQFQNLCEVIGAGAIVPVLFFDVIDEDYRTCIAKVERNKQVLSDYWMAAEDDAAFSELCSAGWQGRLQPRTRGHYLKRLENLYPVETDEQRVERVLQYLAMVLLYEQTGLLRLIDDRAMRLAFYPPAPLLAEDRVRSRIHLRGLPESLCSLTMPPWTSKGCWMLGPNGSLRPRIESFHELHGARSTVDRGDLLISNGADVGSARTDIVQRGGTGRPLQITNR